MAELTKEDWELVKAYADNSMNLAETAKMCYMHYNTAEYHLNKVRRLTGLNPKCFYDLVKLMEVKGDG